MNDVAEHDNNPLDDLLTRMPEIAKAVAAFPEGVQQSAFDALIAAATGAPVASEQQLESGDSNGDTPGSKRKKESAEEAHGGARRG